MSSNFDYNQFKAQHELQKAVRALTTTLRESRNAADQLIFPAPPNGQDGPFELMLQALQIEQDAPPVPLFDFEHSGITLQEIERRCRTQNLDLMTVTQTRAHRVYFNEQNEANQPPRWVEVSKPEDSDPTAELNELIFLDNKNTVVDWASSLANLKRLGLERRYTEAMMRVALLRIISKYLPEQFILLKDTVANEIARFLLRLDSKVDKIDHYRKQILTMCRNPQEDLDSALARLTNVLDKIYPAAQADNVPIRENLLKAAVLAFTPDDISLNIMGDVKKAALKCKPLSLAAILELAKAAEHYAQYTPTQPLYFSRSIGGTQQPDVLQLNNMAVGYSTTPHRRHLRYSGFLNPLQDDPMYVPATQMLQQPVDPLAAQAVAHQAANQAALAENLQQQQNNQALGAGALDNEGLGIDQLFNLYQQQMLGHQTPPRLDGEIPTPFSTPNQHFGGYGDLPTSGVTPTSSRTTGSTPSSSAKTPLKQVDFKNVPLTVGISRAGNGFICRSGDQIFEVVNVPADIQRQIPQPALTESARRRLDSEFDKTPLTGITTRSQSKQLASSSTNSCTANAIQNSNSRSNSSSNKRSYDRSRSKDKPKANVNDQYRQRSKSINNKGHCSSCCPDSRYKNRSSSRGKPNSDKTPSAQYPTKERGRSTEKKYPQKNNSSSSKDRGSRPNSQNTGRKSSRSNSAQKQTNPHEKRLRSLSNWRNTFPNMRRGDNCSRNYNPDVEKRCRKCPKGDSHHEFECYSYNEFNPNLCKLCGSKYNHYPTDCKEGNKFPPKTHNSSSEKN
jgi:hypothetical protein